MKILLGAIITFFLGFSISASAKDLTIGMGNYEPYYITSSESGIFTDVLKAVFNHIPAHQPIFLFDRPNKRLWADFRKGKVDGVANVFDDAKFKGCKTDRVFRFHDVAITRAKDTLQIDKISDLSGKRVIAFQGASKFMGQEFSTMTNFKSYTELANQELQARMLNKGRAEVSVGDMFLFLQSIKNGSGKYGHPLDYRIHLIFPTLTTRMAFRNASLCQSFNEALRKVRKSGTYEKIYETYLKRLSVN